MRIPPFSTPGRFWRGNLHTHSSLSDGALNPAEVVEAYKRAGYDFLELSDHFLGRFDWPIADTRKLRSNKFTTLIGAEVHAMTTSAGEYWHIVATGLPLDFPPAEPDESGPVLAARAKEAGAFVTIAHPAWSQLTIEDGRSLAAAHAVEVYNHGCAVLTDRGDGFYLLDQLCNEDRRLTAVASDDAHFHHGDLDAFGGYVRPGWHATTILMVRKGGTVVIGGDGQVSIGQTVIKGNARKVAPARQGRRDRGLRRRDRRRLHAVRTARGQARAISRPARPRLRRTGQGLAHRPLSAPAGGDAAGRRQDRRLRAVRLGRRAGAGGDANGSAMAIGSGGNYALAAARALMPMELEAEEIVRRSMRIAADICVYTNTISVLESL
jgi:hypothetical protein